jgi:hypothetical protein
MDLRRQIIFSAAEIFPVIVLAEAISLLLFTLILFDFLSPMVHGVSLNSQLVTEDCFNGY